jgi:hypothetical protein
MAPNISQRHSEFNVNMGSNLILILFPKQTKQSGHRGIAVPTQKKGIWQYVFQVTPDSFQHFDCWVSLFILVGCYSSRGAADPACRANFVAVYDTQAYSIRCGKLAKYRPRCASPTRYLRSDYRQMANGAKNSADFAHDFEYANIRKILAKQSGRLNPCGAIKPPQRESNDSLAPYDRGGRR